MSGRVQGKVAVITGGAAGIGRATAILLAEEGAQVVVADRDELAGAETVARIRAEGGEAILVAADVSQASDTQRVCEETLKAFGQLNILVNSAAVFVLKGLEATADDWQRSWSVNVIGASLMTRCAAEAMKQNGGGAIVNMGSISAFIAQPSFMTYSATKAAMVQMSRNMAMELAPFQIRVNCVCPGTILTRAASNQMELLGMNFEEFMAAEAPKHLLGRIGQPREVACAILFLASDEASFVTGTYLMVDGGYMAK